MKAILRTVLVCSLLVGPLVSAPAANADDNESACGAKLCLAGLIDGGIAGGTCKQYMAVYFAIQRFHHGHFDLSGTSNARCEFMASTKRLPVHHRAAINCD